MQIDYDLIRTILLTLESLYTGESHLLSDLQYEFPEIDIDTLRYHLSYLLQKDIINSELKSTNALAVNHVIGLTPQGHDFLETIRNDGVWKEVKAKIKPVGNVSIGIIISVATELIKQKLGLTP